MNDSQDITPLFDEARRAAWGFDIPGEYLCVEGHHRGHIHDTYISTWRQGKERKRFLHQRMNNRVFHDIPALMHNIASVTKHLGDKQQDAAFQTLSLVPTRTGASYLLANDGPWRTYQFIENTTSFDRCRGMPQAHDAARAFGRFQAQLADLDPGDLRETIPNFFSSPHRLRQFGDTLDLDPKGRGRVAAAEIAFARERAESFHEIDNRLADGRIPPRIVHGDTKLNNVLFDRDTERAVCIVDLDTCMPGYSLYDFGDLVRFTAATCEEDEPDATRAGIDLDLYRALVDGYLEGAGDLLLDEEIELMPFAARLVTLTIGLRFLTDFLAGDVYFKTERDRPQHNLERARVQFEMVRAMEENADAMRVTR